MPTRTLNFHLLAPLVSEIWRGPKIKIGPVDLPRCHLAEKFLYRALVLVNAYKFAKLQLPSSISFGYMDPASTAWFIGSLELV